MLNLSLNGTQCLPKRLFYVLSASRVLNFIKKKKILREEIAHHPTKTNAKQCFPCGATIYLSLSVPHVVMYGMEKR